MLSPDVEAERCRAVEQLYLIDTAPEERFAQITRMARSALELTNLNRVLYVQPSPEGAFDDGDGS